MNIQIKLTDIAIGLKTFDKRELACIVKFKRCLEGIQKSIIGKNIKKEEKRAF